MLACQLRPWARRRVLSQKSDGPDVIQDLSEPAANDDRILDITRLAMNVETAQRYARGAAVLYIVTIIAGGWGEAHVPSTLLLANDVAGTAQKVASSMGLFRGSFIAYLLEATCDIVLNVLLYALLRPVSRTLALLALCFGLMATSIYVAGEMLYFAAALPAMDIHVSHAATPEARAALTYFCLTIYSYVNGIFATFYGTAALVRGYLMLRSGFLPRPLGALFMLGGASFIADNVIVILAPHYDLPFILLPMFIAMVSWTLWLLIKGIDRTKYDFIQASSAVR